MSVSEASFFESTPWKAKTLLERNECMWNNPLLSDVEFLFRSSDSETVVVPAHSFILATNSPVLFEKMMKNTRREKMVIEIADCEPEIFRLFLHHLYNDELELSTDCLLDLTRLAIKYSVSSLIGKCIDFAKNVLNSYNVFTILQCAETLKDTNLQQSCWDLVDLHTVKVIKSEDFLKISQDLMLKLLQRDSLRVREVELFNAFCRWITFPNGKQNKNSRQNYEQELNLKLVDQIRFPLMSQREFAENVPQKGFLIKEDIINMFSYFCSTSNVDVRFSRKPRAGTLTRCRLFPESRKWFMYSGACPEYLTLSVNSPIMFCGVRMFGSERGRYSVSLEIYAQNKPLDILAVKKGVYESESEVQKDYFGFDVFLDKPVLLKKSLPYSLKVLLEGPPSFYGCHGYSVVECGEKTFTFFRDNCPIFSRFQAGQFAEVIFM